MQARSALDLARRIGYPAGEARALMKLSEIAMYTGQGEDAVAWAVQARQVPGDRIPAWYARRIDSNLAWALVCSGEVDGVPELCDQLLAEARTVGDLSEQADTLFLMAVAALRGGRLAAARALPPPRGPDPPGPAGGHHLTPDSSSEPRARRTLQPSSAAREHATSISDVLPMPARPSSSSIRPRPSSSSSTAATSRSRSRRLPTRPACRAVAR